jgi:hypothetical protein
MIEIFRKNQHYHEKSMFRTVFTKICLFFLETICEIWNIFNGLLTKRDQLGYHEDLPVGICRLNQKSLKNGWNNKLTNQIENFRNPGIVYILRSQMISKYLNRKKRSLHIKTTYGDHRRLSDFFFWLKSLFSL